MIVLDGSNSRITPAPFSARRRGLGAVPLALLGAALALPACSNSFDGQTTSGATTSGGATGGGGGTSSSSTHAGGHAGGPTGGSGPGTGGAAGSHAGGSHAGGAGAGGAGTSVDGGLGGAGATSQGGSGGTGGSGPIIICQPGVQEACYDGPPGTEGVGICKGGLRTCDAIGDAWGPCKNEVTPLPADDCTTPVDDDCDGKVIGDDGCLCIPNVDTKACYDGPQGTLGVGVCVGGTATCNPDGTSFGACVGEVLPSKEICATAADEDCDGKTFDDAADGCVCKPADKAACYDGPAGTLGVGVCVGGQKTCNANGMSWSACIGEQLPAPKDDCTNQLDDDCDGVACAATLWAHLYGDSASQWAPFVGWDSNGNLLAAGTFNGSIDFGDGPHIGAGGGDIYAVKLDPNGKVLWSKAFGNADVQWLDAFTVTPSGDVLLAFRTASATGIDGGWLALAYGPGMVVAELSGATGKLVTANSLGGTNFSASIFGLARSATALYAVGGYTGSSFANAQLGAAQGEDAFVLSLNPSTLSPTYGRRFGDAAHQIANTVAIDPGGNVLVGGTFEGALTGVSPAVSKGGYDAFVARFSSNLGASSWVRTWGDAADQTVTTLATDANGGVLVGGDFGGTVDFGGGVWFQAQGTDVFTLKLDAAGGHVWSRTFGSTGDDHIAALAARSTGELVVTGYYSGTFSGGNVTLPWAGNTDAFLLSLDNLGGAKWSKGFGDGGFQSGNAVALGAGGRIALGAEAASTIDFGLGVLTAAGSSDVGIAVFNP